jgi:translation initiation factor 4E
MESMDAFKTTTKVDVDPTKKDQTHTQLYSTFNFWFKVVDDQIHQNTKQINQNDYSDMVKNICEFDNLEKFWEIYQFLKKPEHSKHGLEISLFKSNIKPMWEDAANKNGGKVSIKIKKEYSNLIWDELVYRFIGNNFPVIDNAEINGLVFSIKRDSNFVQVWLKNFNSTIVSEISASVKQILSIPELYDLDIRPFNKPKDNLGGNNQPQRERVHKKIY